MQQQRKQLNKLTHKEASDLWIFLENWSVTRLPTDALKTRTRLHIQSPNKVFGCYNECKLYTHTSNMNSNQSHFKTVKHISSHLYSALHFDIPKYTNKHFVMLKSNCLDPALKHCFRDKTMLLVFFSTKSNYFDTALKYYFIFF